MSRSKNATCYSRVSVLEKDSDKGMTEMGNVFVAALYYLQFQANSSALYFSPKGDNETHDAKSIQSLLSPLGTK